LGQEGIWNPGNPPSFLIRSFKKSGIFVLMAFSSLFRFVILVSLQSARRPFDGVSGAERRLRTAKSHADGGGRTIGHP
jgi:hypothetical protein